MLINPPFGYREIVPLYKNSRVRLPDAGTLPQFCSRSNAIPLSYSEFGIACRDYPLVFTSSDGGRTFASPIRVSEDKWMLEGCPDDGPAMALDGQNRVHLAWPTVVSQPEPHKAMFYATSRDGLRFTPRVRVSPVGHNIAHPQIAVGVDGQVVVVWDQIVQGKRRVFLSRLRDGAFAEGETLSEDASASYPVAAFSDGALVVVWTEGTSEASRIAIRRIARR